MRLMSDVVAHFTKEVFAVFGLFSRKPKVTPELEAALGENFLAGLRALVKQRMPADSHAHIERNDSKSWLSFAVLQYAADSIETAKAMGRPVREPQDLVAISHFTWVALREGAVLSRGAVSKDAALGSHAWLVLAAATLMFGEQVPESIVDGAVSAGHNDAVNLDGDRSTPINRAISLNFQEFVATKEARLANLLGKYLKQLDSTP